MAQYTQYPDRIDTSTQLPKAVDRVTPVSAEVVNRLRDAILSIETELGTNPSGTYGTVKDRLDALQSGSGTGSGAIEILQDGVQVLPSAIGLDFTGNVSVSSSQPLRAQVEIIGGQATQVQETITVSSNGQTSFTLSETPIQDSGVLMFINGIKQTRGVDFSSSGTSVLYSALVSLETTDKVEFWYLVDIGSLSDVGGNVEIQENGSSVDTAATLLNFTGNVELTNPLSGQVTINIPGLQTEEDGYSVDTSVTLINFTGNVGVTNPSSGEITVNIPGIEVQQSAIVIESNALTLNFTGNVSVSSTASNEVEIEVITPPTLEFQEDGYVVDAGTDTLNVTGKVNVSHPSSGSISLTFPESKIRMYRASTPQAGASLGTNQTATWNGTSTLVSIVNATIQSGTQLTPYQSGHFICSGQMTISQTSVDAVSGITIEILKNSSTVVHSIKYNTTSGWTTGTMNSFNWSFPIDLDYGNTLEARWRHNGLASSTTQLEIEDWQSWFAITLV